MFATEFDQTSAMLDECSALAERFDDDLLRARIKECRGHATLYRGDLPAAVDLLEEARAGFRAVGDPLGEFDTLILLSAAMFFLDDPRLEEFSRQGLALAERYGALSSKAYGLWSVGIEQWRAGLFDEATSTLRESVALFLTMNSAGERITSRIRTDVFSYIDRLPMGFHDRQSIGELTTRVIQDTGKIQDSLVDLFSTFFPAVLTLFGTAAFLIALDWRLGLIGLCVAPLVFLVANHYARLTRQTSRKRRAAVGKLTGFVTESLQGMRTIHAFGSQDSQEQRFGQDNREVLQLGLRSVDLSAQFSPVLQVIAAFGTAGLLFVGGYGALVGWWQVGVLVVATTYLKNMSSSIWSAACSSSWPSRPSRASSRLPMRRVAALSKSGKKAPWRLRVSIRPSV